jgi:hypothetical protein
VNPEIDHTRFGAISIAGKTYNHDVIIRLDGSVEKRKKKLSKAIYGTSHTISLDEAKYIYEEGADRIIIGAGQFGRVQLSEEAIAFFNDRNCLGEILPTPKSILAWNEAEGDVIGLFHITC